eukprot:gene12189-5776_t
MSLNVYFIDKNKQQEVDNLKLQAKILYISFTKNSFLFTIGLDTGYQIFSCEGVKLQEKEGFSTGGIGVVELKDPNSKVVTLVGGGKVPGFSKNKAIVWDYEAKKALAELTCPKDIHSIKMVGNVIVAVTLDYLYIYNQNCKEVFKSKTNDNTLGVCAVNFDNSDDIIAFPDEVKGCVHIYNITQKSNQVIDAHVGEIVCIAFSKCGKYIATASDKGTLIKIFSLKDLKKVEELRRGSQAAKIYSISFSFDSKYLICSSDSGTIHFFQLNSSNSSFFSKLIDSANRSISQYKNIKGAAICSFSPDDSKLIYVISSTGEFHTISFQNYDQPTCESYDFLKHNSMQ